MNPTQATPDELEAIEKQEAEKRADEAQSMAQKTLLEEIREATHEDMERVADAHKMGEENLRFVAGDTWDPTARAKREEEKRPILSFCKLNQYIDRVHGAMVQRRPAVTVRADDAAARGARANTESKKRIKGAQLRAGMLRQIDEENNAILTYLDAYESGLGVGFGHWRYRIDYVSWSYDQVILIEPIIDPFAVVWDAASTAITNADARRCLIRSSMPKALFRQEYPGAAMAGADYPGLTHVEEWLADDAIVVCEWFVKRPQDQVICELSDGRVVRWESDTEKIRNELAAMGVTVKRHRPHKGHVIEWQKVAGLDVLEGPVVLPGEHIPVVTTYGRRLWKDGKIIYRSLIQHAKDEQRAYDYARTRAIEKAALAPLTPFIIGTSQVKGFEKLWRTANTKSHAYLPYNDSEKNPNRPSREYGGTDLGGLDRLIALSEEGMMSATGQYEASRGQRSNETSGRAVLARAQQADQITAPFEENFHAALTHGARIVMDWLPIVYTSGRVATLLNEDGTSDAVLLGREEIVDEQSGETVVLNDLSVGRYSVKIDTAPAFTTRRQEAVQGLTEFGKAFGPEVALAVAPDVLANSDFPGAERMSRRVEAMLPPEIREAADQEDDDNALPPEAQAVVEKAEKAIEQAGQMVETVRAEAEGVIVERNELKQRLEAERLAAETAKERLKVEYDKRLLALERSLFRLEQQAAAKPTGDEPVAA